jgi:hypothetical protein
MVDAGSMEYQNLYQDGLPPQAPGPAGRRGGGRGRRIAASAAAAVVLLGTGAAMGVALTGGASAATSGAPAATAKPAGPCRKLAATRTADGHPAAARRARALCRGGALLRLAAHGLYGEVTFRAKGGGTRTLAFERGTVQSVTGSAVTVRAVNGTTWTWHVVADTVVREAGQKVALSKLTDGATVLVAGPVRAGADDARLIRIRAAG